VVTCLGRVVVRELSGGEIFQAGMTFESWCRDLAAFGGGSHGCWKFGRCRWCEWVEVEFDRG
jgi:hypothetical protein